METLQERIQRLLPPAEFVYTVDVNPLANFPDWQAVSVTVLHNVTSQGATMLNRKQAMDCSALSDGQLKSWLAHHLESIRHEMKIQALKAKKELDNGSAT
jgi:hypothetical protein